MPYVIVVPGGLLCQSHSLKQAFLVVIKSGYGTDYSYGYDKHDSKGYGHDKDYYGKGYGDDYYGYGKGYGDDY